MPRFYLNLPLCAGTIVELPEDVVRHILVLRLKINDSIVLFNGDGNTYRAYIVEISRKIVLVNIEQQIKPDNQATLNIHLLLCIIANDKMDLAIQKAVELGVAEITPIISERSQRLHPDKVARRMEHWQKIIISSCEQCGNNFIPKINLPQQFITIAASKNSLNLIMSTSSGNYNDSSHRKICIANSSDHTKLTPKLVQLLVGPEGGFSQTEKINGFMPLILGQMIFRSETAVIAGLCYVQLYYGNW